MKNAIVAALCAVVFLFGCGGKDTIPIELVPGPSRCRSMLWRRRAPTRKRSSTTMRRGSYH